MLSRYGSRGEISATGIQIYRMRSDDRCPGAFRLRDLDLDLYLGIRLAVHSSACRLTSVSVLLRFNLYLRLLCYPHAIASKPTIGLSRQTDSISVALQGGSKSALAFTPLQLQRFVYCSSRNWMYLVKLAGTASTVISPFFRFNFKSSRSHAGSPSASARFASSIGVRIRARSILIQSRVGHTFLRVINRIMSQSIA